MSIPLQDLPGAVGRRLGPTSWITVTIHEVEGFAAATGAAATGGQIPPLLLLSLTNRFLPDLVAVTGAARGVNYGAGPVRFPEPVAVGAHLRAGAQILAVEAVAGGYQSTVRVTQEVKGRDTPACVADTISPGTCGEAELNGQVVLVTGGARGLGRGLVDAFAAAGATVVACGRHRPDGDRPGEFVACDVRQPEEVEALVAGVAERWGRLDVVVNNAGGTPYAEAATVSPRLFERILALNLAAPFYVAQRANAVMQDQDGGGVIVNIGSAAARRPAPGSAAYNAAKAGLVALTRTLAIEWAPAVRVNCVSVGLARTESVTETYGRDVAAVEATVPMGRLATAADVAGACLWLASPAAAYVTGADLEVDGGGETPAFLGAVVTE